jgi:hypothetical protein
MSQHLWHGGLTGWLYCKDKGSTFSPSESVYEKHHDDRPDYERRWWLAAFVFTADHRVLDDWLRWECEGYEPDFYLCGD